MSKRVLIAGVGNIFLGDDAFGVEVIRALSKRSLSAGARVVDFGIRGIDLAYALLDPWDAVILADAIPRGEAPGTLYTIAPDLSSIQSTAPTEVAIDAHSMDPVRVLQLAASMGEIPRQVYVVGCEPGDCGGDEGRMGLTPAVESSIPEAVCMVENLLQQICGNATTEMTEGTIQEVR